MHQEVPKSLEGLQSSDNSDIVTDCGLSETNIVQAGHTEEDAMLVGKHLKLSLEGLVLSLFPRNRELQIRWIEGYFPFTSPSWELEVLYQGKWLELCGCGVIQQPILNMTGMLS
jgi:phenylalanyl-tRNA synthetase alpha chain